MSEAELPPLIDDSDSEMPHLIDDSDSENENEFLSHQHKTRKRSKRSNSVSSSATSSAPKAHTVLTALTASTASASAPSPRTLSAAAASASAPSPRRLPRRKKSATQPGETIEQCKKRHKEENKIRKTEQQAYQAKQQQQQQQQQQNNITHRQRRKTLSAGAAASIKKANTVAHQEHRKTLSAGAAASIQKLNTVAHQQRRNKNNNQKDTKVPPDFVLKRCSKPCEHCGYVRFVSDTKTFCCNGGKHILPPLNTCPEYEDLYNIVNVSALSSQANNNLAFSSLGAYPQHGMQTGMGPLGCARLQGRMYSRIIPANIKTSSLHYYVLDQAPDLYMSKHDKDLISTDTSKLRPNEKHRVEQAIQNLKKNRVELQVLTNQCWILLKRVNPYANKLKKVNQIDLLKGNQALYLDVELHRRDGRDANIDLTEKEPCIAFRYGANTETQPPLNTVVFPLNSQLQPKFVPVNYPWYNALQYPILFPFGEMGSGKTFSKTIASETSNNITNSDDKDNKNNHHKNERTTYNLHDEDDDDDNDNETIIDDSEDLDNTKETDELDYGNNDDEMSECSTIVGDNDDYYFDLREAMDMNEKDDRYGHYFGNNIGRDMRNAADAKDNKQLDGKIFYVFIVLI